MTRRSPKRLLDVYRATDGWRWRLTSSGRIIADSGQAYGRRVDCEKAARSTFDRGRLIEIRIETTDGRMVPPPRLGEDYL